MTSVVAICNRALSKIGDELIVSSLEDGSKSSRYCKALFEQTKNFVLRSYPWRFALKRYALAPLKEKPLFDFEYQFSLPVDCLRIWKTKNQEPYQVEGNAVLANSNVFLFVGIAQVEDPSLFDAMFVEALALKLASDLAIPLTASTTLKEKLIQEYETFLPKAKTISAMEGSQDVYMPQGWLEARM